MHCFCAALRRAAVQAEKNGIPWREEVKRFETDPRFQARASALLIAHRLWLLGLRRCMHARLRLRV